MTDHSLIIERRFKEVMAMLEHVNSREARRLRAKYRREDEAWARGEELPAPEYYEAIEPDAPNAWQRFADYWRR